MAIRLVVNARSLQRRTTGVERYTSEVVSRLRGRIRSESPKKALPLGAGYFWEQVILPGRVKDGELLWSPANIGPLLLANQVLTLHDISVLENPEWFHPAFAAWYRWLLPRLVRRVRRVLTVSEYSRRRILETFSLLQDQVVVSHGGVDLTRFQPASEGAISQVRQRYGLKNDFILFIGTLEPRKNLNQLLKAWRRVRTDFSGLELVIAGGQASHFARIGLIPSQPGLRLLGYVPEGDLPGLYSGAKAFVLPSLTEGFGLSVLEAMACGTPVISSNAGALPETIGNAGWLVDSSDPDCLAEAISLLLSERDCWLEYRQRGFERVQHFSWEKTADIVWQELQAACQEG